MEFKAWWGQGSQGRSAGPSFSRRLLPQRQEQSPGQLQVCPQLWHRAAAVFIMSMLLQQGCSLSPLTFQNLPGFRKQCGTYTTHYTTRTHNQTHSCLQGNPWIFTLAEINTGYTTRSLKSVRVRFPHKIRFQMTFGFHSVLEFRVSETGLWVSPAVTSVNAGSGLCSLVSAGHPHPCRRPTPTPPPYTQGTQNTNGMNSRPQNFFSKEQLLPFLPKKCSKTSICLLHCQGQRRANISHFSNSI